jgi:hypothetical protein
VSEFDTIDWKELERKQVMYSIRSKIKCFDDETYGSVMIYKV